MGNCKSIEEQSMHEQSMYQQSMHEQSMHEQNKMFMAQTLPSYDTHHPILQLAQAFAKDKANALHQANNMRKPNVTHGTYDMRAPNYTHEPLYETLPPAYNSMPMYAVYSLLSSDILTHGPPTCTAEQAAAWCTIDQPPDVKCCFYARQLQPSQYNANDVFAFAVYERIKDELIPHPHIYTRSEAEMYCRRAQANSTTSTFFIVRQLFTSVV